MHPDVAKKKRELERLIANGYPSSHPACEKVRREMALLKKLTKR